MPTKLPILPVRFCEISLWTQYDVIGHDEIARRVALHAEYYRRFPHLRPKQGPTPKPPAFMLEPLKAPSAPLPDGRRVRTRERATRRQHILPRGDSDTIDAVLHQLRTARSEGNRSLCSALRRKLRSLGHQGGLRG